MPEIEELESVGSEQPVKKDEKRKETLFFDALQSYKPHEWERELVVYLYRYEPRRMESGGKNPYICKYVQPISEDDIKGAYGSGKYHLRLHRIATKTGKSSQIDSLIFVIEDARYPPIMPGLDETWKTDPINKRWVWDSKDKKDGAATSSPMSAPAGWSPEDVMKVMTFAYDKAQPKNDAEKSSVTSAVIDAMSAANKESISMVVKQIDAQSPDKVVGLVTALQGLITRPQSEGSSLKETLGLVKEIVEITRPAAPAATTSFFGQMKEMGEAMVAMREVFSEGGGGRLSKWDWVPEIARMLPQAIGQVGYVIGNVAAAKAAERGMAVVVPPPPALQPPSEGGIEEEIQTSAPGAPASAPTPNPSPQMMELVGLGQRLIGALQRELSGYDFALAMRDLEGPLVYQRFASMGKDGLLALVQKYPPLWDELRANQAQLEVFLDEFVRMPEIEAEEERMAAEEEAAAKPRHRARGRKETTA